MEFAARASSMPDHGEFQKNAVSSTSHASPHDLEEDIWKLKVEDNNKEGVDANQNTYPDRPGAPDCIFYLRTGLCGYGSNCRYNHPTYNGQGTQDRGELPERVGQPDCQIFMQMYISNLFFNADVLMRSATIIFGNGYCLDTLFCQIHRLDSRCQRICILLELVMAPRERNITSEYFLKTGTCKYGSSCKYHHPRDRYDARPTPLNVLGFPMRQDEKSCPYYMRTGSCKFGVACKFNHPQPATFGAVFPATGPSGYGSPGSLMAPPSSIPLMGGLSTWPLARPYLTSPRMQGLPAYMPVIFPSSQGALPIQQGWSSYMGSVSQLQSTDVTGPTQTPNTKSHAQSGSGTTANLPERLDQPECQYYMKTGSCKYGTTCRYHHPKERYSDGPLTIGPLGLPLRPGHDICTYYSTYGSCRYGTACKYDHPLMGFYNYAVPTLSVPDPSPQLQVPQATWRSPTTETPTFKTAKSPDRLKTYGPTNGTEAKSDSDNSHDHINNPPATQATSPSTTDTAQSSDSPQRHSD